MIRTFHSIGQGAFYTEVFKGLNVVYDCGSSTDINILIKEIKATFDEKEKIDLLFISHFHEDHINGIDFLLDYCDIKYVLLPLQQEIDKVYTLIDNYYNSYEENDLILAPKDFVGKRAKVVFVHPEDKKLDVDTSLDIEELSNVEIISSGTRIHSSKHMDWFFIPFNFRQDSRTKILSNELKSKGININSIDDFLNCWKDRLTREEIINCYKNVPGDFNTNSLTLYSGPINNIRFFSRYIGCLKCRGRLYGYNAGCLYLGDYDANGSHKWSELENKYEFIWNDIGNIQIPHHGSRHNFRIDLINKKSNIMLIISAGYNNKYRHPHSKVLKELAMRRFDYYLINECKGSEVKVFCNIG